VHDLGPVTHARLPASAPADCATFETVTSGDFDRRGRRYSAPRMTDLLATNSAIYSFMEAASPYLVLWSSAFTVLTTFRLVRRLRQGVERLPDSAAYTELAGLPLTLMPSVAFVWALATRDWRSALLFLWWGPGFVLTAVIFIRARKRGTPVNWYPVRYVIAYLCKGCYVAYMALFLWNGMPGMMFAFSVWIINDQYEKTVLSLDADRLRRTLDDHWLFRIAYPAGLLIPWIAPGTPNRVFALVYGTVLLVLWGAGISCVARKGMLRVRPPDLTLLRNMVYFPRARQ
jgi:hypothetical protein